MFSLRQHSQSKRWNQTSSCGQKETNNLFWLKAQCCGEAWSYEQLHRKHHMGWWLPIQVASVTTEPSAREVTGVLRGRLAAERERDVSLLARGRTWLKWSAFLNANQDFWILNVIVWEDAYNLQTGSNSLHELCFLFWKGTAWRRIHWVDNTCYYTFLGTENQHCLCLHLCSACILRMAQPCAVQGWRRFTVFCIKRWGHI